MRDLSAADLREVLNYEPATGIFTWRVTRSNNAKSGSIAGYLGQQGYRIVVVNRQNYLEHRLVWLWVYGEWPANQLDHINGRRDDNRIANLRNATNSQNQMNARRRSDNTSGFKGVTFHKKTGKWAALAAKNGKQIHIGLFGTAKEAHIAYSIAAKKFYGEFAKPT